jgi:hypothetical protein
VGTSPGQLRALAEWFIERDVDEVVMESTAQYWRPVWETLEQYWQPQRRQRAGAGPDAGMLHLAQAQSTEGARGRKKDYPDAERLVRRLVAHELTLSFVPDVTQRLWRTITRRKYQLTSNRVQLQNRLECLLEEAHLKILHDGVAYEERGPAVSKQRAQRRAAKMIRELRSLGYRIELPSPSTSPA